MPYFKIKNTKEHFLLARFLKRKFYPQLRKRVPQHYLLTQDIRTYLKFIKQTSKKYPYFLRFDIDKYFPSINHSLLLSELKSIYSQLTGKPLSRRFSRFLKYNLPDFLKLSPYPNQGLAIGSPLSYILAGVYLLRLDLTFNLPFIRYSDDYLIFSKTQSHLQKTLANSIIPILTELHLSLNLKKTNSGRFHRDKVNFLGFDYTAGYIRISEDKIEGFKHRIKKITYLTRKKSIPAIIKLLNNQILGFGHLPR